MRKTPPGLIMLELHAQRLDSYGYEGGALALLQRLHSLGYTDISHSGYANGAPCRSVCSGLCPAHSSRKAWDHMVAQQHAACCPARVAPLLLDQRTALPAEGPPTSYS